MTQWRAYEIDLRLVWREQGVPDHVLDSLFREFAPQRVGEMYPAAAVREMQGWLTRRGWASNIDRVGWMRSREGWR